MLIILLLSFILLINYQSELSTTTTSIYSIDNVNKGIWLIIRVVYTLIITAAIMLFDSSAIFRLLTIISLPILSAIDLYSEINLAYTLFCYNRNICQLPTNMSYTITLILLYRDLISAILMLIACGLSIWLTALFGSYKNLHYIPPEEHNNMSKKLELIHKYNDYKKSKIINR